MNAMLRETKSAAAPLVASGLVHCYEGSNALNGINLVLQPGSVLGLIGRNGAGKSTFSSGTVAIRCRRCYSADSLNASFPLDKRWDLPPLPHGSGD